MRYPKYKREFLVQNAPELPPLGFSSLRKIPFPLSLKKSHQERTSKKVFCVVLEEHRNNINNSSVIILLDDFRVLLRETQ